MPSFNWSRLRPIAHSIASTIRHAQASAYQLHRDLETIREENRRYAAVHYGTAPHWDGYGPDGRRTSNGGSNGNGNRSGRSGSRGGNRNGNSDRQRQRNRSFERSHPWMSRALYYAMPHLGGYETGRGFTWNANGERWGDSFRRGAEYLSNLRQRTAEARAYRSASASGWGTPSGGMPLPNPGGTGTAGGGGGWGGGAWGSSAPNQSHSSNPGSASAPDPNDPNAGPWGAAAPNSSTPNPTPNGRQRTRRANTANPNRSPEPTSAPIPEPDVPPIPQPNEDRSEPRWWGNGQWHSYNQTDFDNTANPNRTPETTSVPIPEPRQLSSPTSTSGSSQRQENTYDRTFNGGRWRNGGQGQQADSTNTDTSSNQEDNGATSQRSQSTDYIFPFGGKTIDEVLAEERAQRERYNREVEMKMHGRTQPDLFEEMERQNKAAIDDWNRRLNKYRSDIDEQYGEFKREADRMMTDSFLPKRTRLALSNDISRMEQRYKRYVRGKYDTDLDGKKAFSEQIANVLEGKFPGYQAAINNMAYEYGEYQNQILLASFYGVSDIPNMSMREYTEWKDDSDFDKYDPLAVQRLIDDLRAGKETTYEQRVQEDRAWSDELRKKRLEENAKWRAEEPMEDGDDGSEPVESAEAEITATQQFDDLKSAMDFVQGEKDHTEEDETVAHDIEISETPDGAFSVTSPVAPEIPMVGDGSEPGTIADAMRNRYPGDNVTISVNGEPITLDQLKHFRLVVNGEDGQEIAVDNLDELFLATFEIARSDGFDGTDNEPINISPSSSTRAAAPSDATRRNAAFIKDAIRKRPKSYTSSEEWIWVSEHFRAGFPVTGYHRGYPTR